MSLQNGANPSPVVKTTFLAGAALVALLLLWIIWPFYSVDAGYIGVKTWFSAPEAETLEPGIHFVIPLIESVHEITIQPQLAQTQETASTNDQQDVNTTVSVNYQVDPTQLVAMYSKYRDTGTLDATIIAPVVSNDTKAVTANYNAQELLTKRSQVRAEIETAIRSDLQPYGVVLVTGVNITDFHYSDEYNAAIEAKQIAQQQALTEQYNTSRRGL
jgi:regulator of protease activity HflC (stomatin/prohibitin superfamily)